MTDERSTIPSGAKIGISHRLRKPEKPSSSQLRRPYQRSGCNGLATKGAIPRPTVCAESDTETKNGVATAGTLPWHWQGVTEYRAVRTVARQGIVASGLPIKMRTAVGFYDTTVRFMASSRRTPRPHVAQKSPSHKPSQLGPASRRAIQSHKIEQQRDRSRGCP